MKVLLWSLDLLFFLANYLEIECVKLAPNSQKIKVFQHSILEFIVFHQWTLSFCIRENCPLFHSYNLLMVNTFVLSLNIILTTESFHLKTSEKRYCGYQFYLKKYSFISHGQRPFEHFPSIEVCHLLAVCISISIFTLQSSLQFEWKVCMNYLCVILIFLFLHGDNAIISD